MKIYLALYVLLLSALPLGQALGNDRPHFCHPDHFFRTSGPDSGTPEEFENSVNNGDPQQFWFVTTALCLNSPSFDIELSWKKAQTKMWNEIFTLTGIDLNLNHYKDQASWISRIKQDYPIAAGFYITSEQLLKLKDSGLVQAVAYSREFHTRTEE